MALAKLKKRAKNSGRRNHMGGKSHRRKTLVLMEVLARQIESLPGNKRAQLNKVRGYRGDIRFFGALQGIWMAAQKGSGNTDEAVHFLYGTIEKLAKQGRTADECLAALQIQELPAE